MTERPDLAALMGSRMCHDLISPIGAIGNGVELMMMDGSAAGPELALIVDSVANANARIRFFRVAFGASGSSDQRIGLPEVKSTLSDLTRGGRTTISWTSGPDLSRREVKLVFLSIQCMESALPQGGRITVEKGETRWTLRAEAARLKIDANLWEVLSNPVAQTDIGPAEVHFVLLRDELTRQHRRLTTELTEGGIRMSF